MPFWTRFPHDRLLVDVSLWSADLGALAAAVERASAHADLFHIDASDSTFVADPLFFPDLVAAVRPHTLVPFHAHLMAHNPAPLAASFARAGADLITVHAEADGCSRALEAIHALGAAAGLALRLDTDPQVAIPYLSAVDAVVMIGTPLGTRGTPMAPQAPQRIAALRRLLDEHGATTARIFADGGIRRSTVPALAAAGTDAVVAGSLLLASDDPAATTAWLHHPTQEHAPSQHQGGGR